MPVEIGAAGKAHKQRPILRAALLRHQQVLLGAIG
jgi:hypothetical protein